MVKVEILPNTYEPGYKIQLFSQVPDASETMTQSSHTYHTHKHTHTQRNLITEAFTARQHSTA